MSMFTIPEWWSPLVGLTPGEMGVEARELFAEEGAGEWSPTDDAPDMLVGGERHKRPLIGSRWWCSVVPTVEPTEGVGDEPRDPP